MTIVTTKETRQHDDISKLKSPGRIAIVTSKTDGLKETGFGSIETCTAMYRAIRTKYQDVTFHEVTTKESLNGVLHESPDLVVLCCKYFQDPDTAIKTWFSEFFAGKGVNFTGSDREHLEFDSNKSKAKTLLQNSGIATAKFFITLPGQYSEEADLPVPLPLFVKPLDAANGNGIDENSIVRDFESYRNKVDEVFRLFGDGVLVEEELSGREYTVAVLDDPQRQLRFIVPLQISPPKNCKGDRVLGYEAKLKNEESLSQVSEPLNGELIQFADRIFTVLGARDFGRIDIKLDASGIPHFLEANLVPGMTPSTSYFPRALFHMAQSELDFLNTTQMTHTDVALKIVELGLNRASLAEVV
ncbi:MAG: hypothetical protein K5905_12975 [Roseibium sp.]|uniref:D-alanine--D-alanine ligase family protein n=1 Tax=Roseibium sp. TaxID=1936156 RepID=UPI002621425F|nr:hypothetical protein [Roseibium sp.]MCV0426380.1 hypothetical protein [Roseibium sp.]